MTDVGTVLNSPAPRSGLVSHGSFLQLNLIFPQATCSCAVQKCDSKVFFQSIMLLPYRLLARSSWGSSSLPKHTSSMFSPSVQLSSTTLPSWWNPMAILVLRTRSGATFSAQRSSLKNSGEAQCIPSHNYKNLLLARLRKGGASVSWKQFRVIHLLIVTWQWSEDIWN